MRSFIFFVLFLAAMYLQAQQTPLINIYRHNWASLNAAAFPRNYLEDQDLQTHIGLVARTQTIFTEGFPQYYQLRFEHIPDLSNSNDMKIGGFISSYQAGAWEETRIQLNYAYEFSLSRQDKISIGLTLGGIQQRIQVNKVNWQTTPNLPANLNSRWLMDVNMGIFYNYRPSTGGIDRYAKKNRNGRNQPHYYAGISMLQSISYRLDNEPGDVFNSGYRPHYYAVAGFVKAGFEPTVWLRYLPGTEYATLGFRNPLSIDLNVRQSIRQMWVGAGVSTNGTGDIEFGVNFWTGGIVGEIGDQLQFALAVGNLGISKLAFGGGPNLELSCSFNFD